MRYTAGPMDPQQLSDGEVKDLVRLAQDGDTEAFSHLYNHFFTPVYRYVAFRLSGDVAEDTVSEIFVKVWEKLHTYKDQQGIPFGAWLFRIARHSVIDAYRVARGFEEVSEALEDPDLLNRADTKAQRNDVLRIVRHALDQLPKRYREVLLLTYVSELPYSEVARVLKMTEGGVRILKLRALRKLETFLPPDMRFRP